MRETGQCVEIPGLQIPGVVVGGPVGGLPPGEEDLQRVIQELDGALEPGRPGAEQLADLGRLQVEASEEGPVPLRRGALSLQEDRLAGGVRDQYFAASGIPTHQRVSRVFVGVLEAVLQKQTAALGPGGGHQPHP